MENKSFRIGEVVPAGDPLARFVTVLAMISNEWHRSMYLMNLTTEDPDGRGIRLLLTRQQAASYLEATSWISDSRKRFTEIETFIAALDAEALGHYDRVMAALDSESPHFLEWLEGHRNVTAHFPKLHPLSHQHGDEEITNALTDSAGITGTITVGETHATVRFGFADEVAVQLLPDIVKNPEEIKKLSGARIALGFFAHATIDAYLRARHGTGDGES